MKITLGDTDGDTEAKLASALIGYNVKVVYRALTGFRGTYDLETQDIQLKTADNAGIGGYLLNDDGDLISGSPVEGYEWIDIEEIHVY